MTSRDSRLNRLRGTARSAVLGPLLVSQMRTPARP